MRRGRATRSRARWPPRWPAASALETAVRLASAAGAHATLALGARASLATRAQAEALSG